MKKLTFIIFTIFNSMSFASDIEIEKGEDGLYWGLYESVYTTIYQVDTVSHVCYASQNLREAISLTTIDCESLAKRKEWHEIITWLPK